MIAGAETRVSASSKDLVVLYLDRGVLLKIVRLLHKMAARVFDFWTGDSRQGT